MYIIYIICIYNIVKFLIKYFNFKMENINLKPKININLLRSDNISRLCPYCKINQKYYSFDMTITGGISADLFRKLFEENWIKYSDSLSKINVEKTCCKIYQSRVDINHFKIDKKQKKVMKNFKLFLKGKYNKDTKLLNSMNNTFNSLKIEKQKYVDKYIEYINKIISSYIQQKYFENIINIYNLNNDMHIHNIINKINTVKNINRNFGDYSSNILILISNLISKINQDDNTNIIKKLFDNFKEFYNNYNNNNDLFDLKLDDKIGRLNFFVKDKINYEKFLNENNINNNKHNNNNNKINNDINNNNNNNDNNNNNNNNNNNVNSEADSKNFYNNTVPNQI